MPGRPPRFLCDEMLQGLGRWLRAAGYDTAIAADGADDATLVRRAREEDRWLVTRDRKMAERAAARGLLLLLDCHDLDSCAQALGQQLDLNWTAAAFTRCIECNRPLLPLPPRQRHRLPPDQGGRSGRRCPGCGRIYWEGGHVRRMRRRLRQWQRTPDSRL